MLRKPKISFPGPVSVSFVVICLAFAVEVGPLAGLDKVGPVERM